MLNSFYRERHGLGNYVLVTDSVCFVVNSVTEDIDRVFPLKQLRPNDLALLRRATIYSCLVDTVNKSVRVSKFEENKSMSAQPIKLSDFIKRDIAWQRSPNFRFRFQLPLPFGEGKYKQVLYVMEVP